MPTKKFFGAANDLATCGNATVSGGKAFRGSEFARTILLFFLGPLKFLYTAKWGVCAEMLKKKTKQKTELNFLPFVPSPNEITTWKLRQGGRGLMGSR